MSDQEDLIVVARIVKVRGLRGEVVADLLTDFPDRFEELSSLLTVSPDGSYRSLQIEEQWLHGDRLVVKFAGFDRIEEATALVGCDLAIPADERVKLPRDSYYEWELIGCRVENVGGETVGQVKGIMHPGEADLLDVIDAAGRERLIPMVGEIVIEVDIEKKVIRIDPPEGLLEL
jgi:16S rRNA processing protein RimM